MLKRRILSQLMSSLLPLFDLVDTSARIFIKRNVKILNQFRMTVLNEVRSILGIVLAGFREIITEAQHKLQTHHIGVAAGLLVQIILLAHPLFPLSRKRLSVCE